MQRETIIEILNEWNYWKRDLPSTLSRKKYEEELLAKSKTQEILFLKGVRRSGKSTILLNHIKNLISQGVPLSDILFVNLEDPRFAPYLSLDLLEKIKQSYIYYLNPKGKPHIFLDEIQNIEGFEKWMTKEYELKQSHLYATGSNSKLLSKEIGSSLSGRYLDIEVFPLDFKEFLSFKGISIESNFDLVSQKMAIERYFEQYLEFGGFPKVVLTEEKDLKDAELKSYFESILLRDIVARYRLDNFNVLERLAIFLLSHVANLVSLNKLRNVLGISYETAERYFEYLHNAFLVFSIPRFDWSLKKQIVSPKKIYSIDTGLSRRISFEVGRKRGDLLENIVFLHLKRLYEEIFYYKTASGYEVDFLLKDREEIRALIQVSWSLQEEKTKKREIRSLLQARKELDCQCPLVILTLDPTEKLDVENDTIHIQNIIEWTLGLVPNSA